MTDEELATVAEKLKNDPSMSLEEVRERKASVKEERSALVQFIRSRTSSRAAKERPNFEALEAGKKE